MNLSEQTDLPETKGVVDVLVSLVSCLRVASGQ